MKFINAITFGSKKSFNYNSANYFTASHLKSGESISALQVEIKKTTHKTSRINAECADIHTHQGVIEGGDITIKYLKGGKISANIVGVDFAEEGVVEANYVHIKKLGSENTLVGTDIIEIDAIEGSQNSITLKPLFDMEKYNVVSALYEKIMFYKKELEKTQKMALIKHLEIENRFLEAQESRAKIKSIRAKREIPESRLLMIVKEFDMLSRSYQQLINVIDGLKTHIDIAVAEFKSYMEEGGFVYPQRVICNSTWKSGNKITFSLPKCDLTYHPLNDENASEIYLWYNCGLSLDANGEFEIKTN
ncbi:MAG: hypothetical protein LBP40_00525 [Campylobacteraceae bacterium]|nr:hypothetical protein [Campylobacteraceae bacterium]